MIALFKNRLAYLSVSLALLVVAFPLISMGTSYGPSVLWWVGLLALIVGGLIPPAQRLLLGPPPAKSEQAPDSNTAKKGESHESP